MLHLHFLVIYLFFTLMQLPQICLRHLIRAKKTDLKMSRVREGHYEAISLLKNGSIDIDWLDLHLGGPSQLDIFVDHEVALETGDQSHEAWGGKAAGTIGCGVINHLFYGLVLRHKEIRARFLEVVCDEAGWSEAESLLETYVASMLGQYEKGLFAQNHDVVLMRVPVAVLPHLPWLLTNISHPSCLHLRFDLILCLALLLSLEVIVGECLH